MAKILVADDEEVLLELVRFSLDAAGHKVTTAKDGKQALEFARKDVFDLIMLDVMMPFVDGYHVANEIAQDPKSPPILLLTSRDYDADRNAIKGSCATAFLAKPFDVLELLDIVKDLIKKPS